MRNTVFSAFVGVLLVLVIGCQSAQARLAEKQRQEQLQESLFKAIEAKDTEKVKQLLKEGADLSTRGAEGMTPLHMALSGDVLIDPDGSLARMVNLLLSNEVLIDAKDDKG